MLYLFVCITIANEKKTKKQQRCKFIYPWMYSVCMLTFKLRVVCMIVAVPLVFAPIFTYFHCPPAFTLPFQLTARAMKQQSVVDGDAIAKSTAGINQRRRRPYFNLMTTDRACVTEAV